MPRITPMLPTVFVPSGTAHRVVVDLLTRSREREAPAPTAERAREGPRSDPRTPLPSAA